MKENKSNFDIRKFVEKIKEEDLPEIIEKTSREAKRIENKSFNKKGAKRARKEGSIEYLENLKGLLFFLKKGKKPDSVSDEVFQKYRPIIKNLVQKGELKKEILEKFNS